MGIGSDIGGSIRAPAFFSGVYGFKSTPQRSPYRGIIAPVPDFICPQTFIHPACGPLALSADDCKLCMESFWKEKNFNTDWGQAPMPFNHELYEKTLEKKLVVGYIDEFPLLPTSQSVKRAMQIAKDAFKKQGHTLVEFKITNEDFKELSAIFLRNLAISFMAPLTHELAKNYEAPIPQYFLAFFVYTLGPIMRRVVKFLAYSLLGQRTGDSVVNIRKFSPNEIDDTQRAHRRMEKKFEDQVNKQNIDVILSPASYHAAFKTEDSNELASVANYFFIWNVVHYPAASVPITEVQENEEGFYMDTHNDILTRKIRHTMQGSKGMPVGIQMAAPKWKDEVLLAAMKILENEVQYIKKPNY